MNMKTQSTNDPTIVIICVWFGPLPDWTRLWLASCAANASVAWLFVTDQESEALTLPPNVIWAQQGMADIAARISDASGVDIDFRFPYKACDYRPLFWSLLDLAPGSWDFWGHCDLDMLFGDIRKFITSDLLSSYDRILGQGHLSLYRNTDLANNFYRRQHPDFDFADILSDPNPRAFDEHLGVNKIWRAHHGRFYQDESIAADIDPNIDYIRLTPIRAKGRNFRYQAMSFEPGCVRRYAVRRSLIKIDDFLYIHFQKRQMDTSSVCADQTSVWITRDGFAPKTEVAITPNAIKKINSPPKVPRPRTVLHQARSHLRYLRNRASHEG